MNKIHPMMDSATTKSWIKRHPILTGLGIFLILLILIGSGGDDTSPTDQEKIVVDTSPTDTTTPASEQTLEQKIQTAVTASLGVETNMKKPRIISVEVEDYKPTDTGYKSTENTKGVFIKINSSENINTKLQKMTLNKEAMQVAQAIFPLDENIGDIIIWTNLPLKDQYGNISDGLAIAYSIAQPLYDKINWANFDYNQLPTLLVSEGKTDSRNHYHEDIKF